LSTTEVIQYFVLKYMLYLQEKVLRQREVLIICGHMGPKIATMQIPFKYEISACK